MIYRLRGILVEKDTEGVVLDVGGVGYRASASLATLRALPSLGEECVVHTRLAARGAATLPVGLARGAAGVAFARRGVRGTHADGGAGGRNAPVRLRGAGGAHGF